MAAGDATTPSIAFPQLPPFVHDPTNPTCASTWLKQVEIKFKFITNLTAAHKVGLVNSVLDSKTFDRVTRALLPEDVTAYEDWDKFKTVFISLFDTKRSLFADRYNTFQLEWRGPAHETVQEYISRVRQQVALFKCGDFSENELSTLVVLMGMKAAALEPLRSLVLKALIKTPKEKLADQCWNCRRNWKNITSISEDELQTFIDTNKANVKWTGEKFEPKTVNLHRINTKTLQSSGQILYKRVVTTKLATTQELQIRASPEYAINSSKSSNMVFYETLQTSIVNFTTDFKAEIERINASITALSTTNQADINKIDASITALSTTNRADINKIDALITNINEKLENRQELYNLLNHTSVKNKLLFLIECSNTNFSSSMRKTSRKENVDRIVADIGKDTKKPYDKNYVRFVNYLSIGVTISCNSSLNGPMDTVKLNYLGEMAFEFVDCLNEATRFRCNVTSNVGKHQEWEVYSYDPINKAHNWFLFNNAIYKGNYDFSQGEKILKLL